VWVRAALTQAQRSPAVAKLILPPPASAPQNWTAYRSRFVEPRRIKAGLAFWQANEEWLKKAQEKYGVPPEIIVGLIGVETIYGQHTGGYRVLDALATLGFAYPAQAPRDRSPYFRNELEQFLLLCHEAALSPEQPLGSYAGAMGMPQFMPGSWRRWAVDFDGDGQIDLWRSVPDAIGSVARYLAEHGWQTDKPTHFAVSPPQQSAALAKLLAPDIVPGFSSGDMSALGANLGADATQYPGLLALIKLENGERAAQYVAGTNNFYALTRYNQSSLYAMAVIELGQTIAKQRSTP
jgi:membrane-bound lytic murein transglycosylase B